MRLMSHYSMSKSVHPFGLYIFQFLYYIGGGGPERTTKSKLKEIKIIFVSCNVDLVGQGHLATILSISSTSDFYQVMPHNVLINRKPDNTFWVPSKFSHFILFEINRAHTVRTHVYVSPPVYQAGWAPGYCMGAHAGSWWRPRLVVTRLQLRIMILSGSEKKYNLPQMNESFNFDSIPEYGDRMSEDSRIGWSFQNISGASSMKRLDV